ncbi:MAG: heavy metal translocating P-type ATPase [Lentisphaeria bacterium]|nr:heavy metal translocating P-type ATPase [Lentisphaeria bacterium]
MKKYHISNLDCADCAAKLEAALQKLPAVKAVSIDFATQSMLLDCSDINAAKAEIRRLEPEVQISEKPQPTAEKSFWQSHGGEFSLLLFALLLFLLAFASQHQLLPESFSALKHRQVLEYGLYLFIYLLAGTAVLARAAKNIVQGRVFDENFLMSISTIGAWLINFPAEAAAVMLFYRIGEFLQELSVQRSRRSIRSLLAMRPEQANLLENSQVKTVPAESVLVNSTIVVNPGERVPLDALVLEGRSMLDSSALTGESLPRSVQVGGKLLAGMLNKQGRLIAKVSKPYQDSALARILELVENAAHKKAETELFFSTFARYYTPAVVLLALLIAALPPLLLPEARFSEWLYRALVVMVISCPCALVVSIPLTYFGALGAASRRGLLIKGSGYLDTLYRLKSICFDKTGTLTRGVFKVNQILPEPGFSKDELLEIAAAAETASNHPIALSIKQAYGKNIDPQRISDYQELEGLGIKAKVDGKTVIAGNDRLLHKFNIKHQDCNISGTNVRVAVAGKYAGHIEIGDEIKTDSAEAIKELKHLGVKNMSMLTGDNQVAAAKVAQTLGIQEFHAELMPEDKLRIMEQAMQKPGRPGTLAFVGDGMNDAPVLARADIGISMGSLGSDAAIETADLVIMNDSLGKIVEAMRLARKNRHILWQNISLALLVKLAFVTLGVIGKASMWEAVFADMGVALLAIANAARMLKDAKPSKNKAQCGCG